MPPAAERRGEAEPEVLGDVEPEQPEGIGADAEIGAVAEGRQPGRAEQEVEGERVERPDQDLDAEIGVEADAGDPQRHRREDEPDDHHRRGDELLGVGRGLHALAPGNSDALILRREARRAEPRRTHIADALILRCEARRAEPRRTHPAPTAPDRRCVLRGSPGSRPGSHLSMMMLGIVQKRRMMMHAKFLLPANGLRARTATMAHVGVVHERVIMMHSEIPVFSEWVARRPVAAAWVGVGEGRCIITPPGCSSCRTGRGPGRSRRRRGGDTSTASTIPTRRRRRGRRPCRP